jgi:23S rRNA (guanosine2251-2'-O)-methyltransferase
VSTIDTLLQEGFELIAVEQTKESILLDQYRFQNDKKFAFIFGNEVDGVSEEVVARCHFALEIPQIGTKHSLNIANAASIVLWEVFKQR